MAKAHEQDLKIIEFIKTAFVKIKVKFEKLGTYIVILSVFM
jgi:hypothetical protein